MECRCQSQTSVLRNYLTYMKYDQRESYEKHILKSRITEHRSSMTCFLRNRFECVNQLKPAIVTVNIIHVIMSVPDMEFAYD